MENRLLRAFNLLLELREFAEDCLICLGTANHVHDKLLVDMWQFRYNNTRWKAGILERYIQEKLKGKN